MIVTPDDLRRLRTRVLAVLATAVVVSVAANVSAAEPTITGRAVAAWPPIALLLVIDVLGKVPTGPGWLGRSSITATGLVAAVAAVASFTHMQAVARTAGESELVAVLFPLSVDGTAIVCSVALIEINRRTSYNLDDDDGQAHDAIPQDVQVIDSADAGTPVPIGSTDRSPVPVFAAPSAVNGSHPPSQPEGR